MVTAPLGHLGNELSPTVPGTALTPLIPHDGTAWDGVLEAHGDPIARDGVGPAEADPQHGVVAFDGKMLEEPIWHAERIPALAGS
jgi:hypothetical protein